MKKTLVNALGAGSALILSLYLWRVAYPFTDWALLLLAPLTFLLFTGSFRASAALYHASMKVAVRTGSPLAWVMTGRLRAIVGASLFTLAALVLLAWYAISATYIELWLLAFLCLVAPLVFAGIEHKLSAHLTPAFSRDAALSMATLLTAVLFMPILASANWNFTPHPGAIRSATLQEALKIGFDQLPVRRGWIAELLAPLYAVEYAKLWLVVQPGASKWLSFWYSIDAALVSLIAARASAVLISIVNVSTKVSEIDNQTS